MEALVSVIVPVFNRLDLITETLDSIKGQSYSNWECILVDDHSTDGTYEKILDYSKTDTRFNVFKRPDNRPKGANACRNYGFEMSSGEYINWFDSDDIMLPEFISNKLYAFMSSTSMVIASGYFVDEDLKNREEIPLEESEQLFVDFAMWRLRVFTPSVMFRREFLDVRALFNEDIQKYQDTEFFSRMFYDLDTSKVCFLNDHSFLYRRHASAMSKTDDLYIPEEQSSIAMIYLQRLKFGLELNNRELTDHFYKRLIALWFRAFRNANDENRQIVSEGLKEILLPDNNKAWRRISNAFRICKLTGKGSYKIKSHLESIQLKIKTK